MKIMLIDFSHTAHSNYHIAKHQDKLNMWKFMVMNSIRGYIRKYKPNEVVIALDNGSWRKKLELELIEDSKKETISKSFYKHERKSDNELYKLMDELIDEMKENFPFKFISCKDTEADDVIGILTHTFKEKNEIIIVGRDKDFKQLLLHKNVTMWNPTKKKEEGVQNPQEFLLKQILSGDRIDGIPNFLSDLDCIIMENKKQNSLGKKKIEEILNMGVDDWIIQNKEKYITKYNVDIEENYMRNRNLIELSLDIIPMNIVNSVLECYNNYKYPNHVYMKIEMYFDELEIRKLNAEDFIIGV